MPVPKDELDKMSARVCAHMNADHADSCVAWARYYARLADAASAEMTAVTPEGWALTVTMRDGSAKSVVVPYDPPLAAAKDVRKRRAASRDVRCRDELVDARRGVEMPRRATRCGQS
mmetsp:Transcript_7271/g.21464  ORF Transcript_7271/g.21464 Transcript_7271/m.21464 type:complete len:117 (-) Transcript_7271:213-563(-)